MYAFIYVCLYECKQYASVFEGMYVLPCADDVHLGLSEGLRQPTNDWSQWAGGERYPAFIRTQSSFSYQAEKLLKYMYSISFKSMYVCMYLCM